MVNYILKEGVPVRCYDIIQRGMWMDNRDNIFVARTQVGEVEVITVFLGTDHNFMPNGEHLLYETMIFGGDDSHMQWRYTTRDLAIDGHWGAVGRLRDKYHPPIRKILRRILRLT